MSSLSNINELSESFLHFLEDDTYNTNNPTFCEEKSNLYHDSSYVWCKYCNKIFCTRCSLNHLISDQTHHNPIDKTFLRKEHFDVEFNRDHQKINEIKRNMEECFNQNKKKQNSQEFLSLYETLSKFSELAKNLSNFLDNFTNKVKIVLDNIQSREKSIMDKGTHEDNVRKNFNDICSKFKMIEKNYYLNPQFSPKQLKVYHDSLASGYEDCQKLKDLLEQYRAMNRFVSEISDKCNKIRNIMNNALSTVKGCKSNFENLINDINI